MNNPSIFFKRAAALVIATILAFAGLQVTPAQAVARTLTWTSAGTIPVASGSSITALRFGNEVFLAVATNGDVFRSSDGLTWALVGALGGPTPPNAGYKADISFGLSGTPVAPDEGVAGTPTWVFTSKDNGTAWTSTDNGATWRVTLSSYGNIKKVVYGDGHFILGATTSAFKTSTNGINWRDAGNQAIAGDNEGRMAFGNHTFVIPRTYFNQICRRSSINWVDNSDFDCTATFSDMEWTANNYIAANYFGGIAFGNGIFVGGLNQGNNYFWTSSDTGATWQRNTSSTSRPYGITFGGGVFVMDKQNGTTAFSADGLTWTTTAVRPNGANGMIAYGAGRFIGLGGSGNAAITSGILSTVAPSTPSGLAGVAGNALVDLTWNASSDDGGAPVSYTVTSNPGALTCTTTTTGCRVTGLTNDTAYTFTVTAANVAGPSSASVATTQLTPFVPVPGSPTGLAGTAGNALVSLTWAAPSNAGGVSLSYTVTSNPGALSCTTTSTSCQITGLTNGTSYTFTATATSEGGTSSSSTATSQLTPAVPVASVSVGSTPNSQVATIPAGVTTAAIPATAELPAISLNFNAASGTATATVEPIVNPAVSAATPFTITGATKIVDIQVTGVTGSVTVCLDGTSSDQLFHYTGGAWVELPQRTFVNGQVCGVTESFSPFAAAPLLPVVQNTSYSGPRISGRFGKVSSTSGGSEFTILGDRLLQVSAVILEGQPLTVASKSDNQLVVKVPAHAVGFVDLLLKSTSGSLIFQDAFEYRAPLAVRVPIMTSKYVIVSGSSATTLNAGERRAVSSFVSSATAGSVLTCSATYFSKTDSAAAKALAIAACATAKKANGNLATRISAPVLVKSRQAREVLLSLTN